ncbi:hypothetical protein O181_120264 [Austropuccinia psidii MF-1]|uniref:Uncharacterized protein n=1 Tax=Austropuccinia psidii MF-1 TaxID=1389203 RepID=A0A9Q3Q078_9BASI|nr:hypothetical protein [Austropuccinia psidii MF-1]
MQPEYSTLYKEFLSSKSKGPGEFFRNINKLQLCCNHHIMLNTMANVDLEDHKGRSTQDNSSTITQTIVDVEICMMSSKISHLLKNLLKNQQSKCGKPNQWFTPNGPDFLICELILISIHYQLNPSDLFYGTIGIALAHHSILSAQIDGTITAQVLEKALENFFNNPQCEVLIASIAAAKTGLNIACTNIVYLMVRGPP